MDAGDRFYGSYITGTDGRYQFTDLLANPYIVTIDTTQSALTGYSGSPGTPDEHPGSGGSDEQVVTLINTGSGTSSDLDQDFGYQNAALFDIGGTVFLDDDRDGFFDSAVEQGFPNVTVALVNAHGDVMATTTAAGDGSYLFEQIPDGDYTVRITDDVQVLQGYELTSGLDEIAVTMAGADVEDIDFGYARDPETGSIGDTIWLDANGDGLQNGSESGIGGVDVELWDVGQDGVIGGGDDTLLDSATSGPDGRYLFTSLSPGDYYVNFVDSVAGVGIVSSNLEGLSRTDNPGSSATTVINLFEGQEYELGDSGWRPTTAQIIGDTIFYDGNADGLQQLGEVGLAGVDVLIGGPGITFGASAVVTTDGTGRYTFLLPVIAGNTDFDVMVCTALTAASFPGGTCNAIPATLNQGTTSFVLGGGGGPPGQNPEAFTVAPVTDRLDADFGFDGAGFATVGDTVFLDRDGSGTQDGIDPGIEGVTVALVLDSNNNGVADTGEPVIAVDATDGNGAYDFLGVDPANNWVVVVTDQNNVLRELNQSTAASSGDVPVLVAGQDYNDADFGFAPRDRGTIGNQFWRDLTTLPGGGAGTLGLFEPGEPGVEGVSVKLWLDNNANGGAPQPGTDNCVRGCVDLLLTDQNGQYEFRGLPPGDYIVEVTDELGVLQGLASSVCSLAECPIQSADDVSKPSPYSTTLTIGTPFDFAGDFGYEPDPVLGSFELTGLVYFDAQPNGDHSVDTPLNDFAVDDVTVSLFLDIDFDGVGDVLYDTVLTSSANDATVNYTFTNLPPASWIVQVSGPGTEIEGADQTEPTTSPGSPANTRPAFTCSSTASLAACQGSGADGSEADFGFNKPPTLVLITGLRTYDDRGSVVVEFETHSEVGAAGFYLWRLDSKQGDYVQVNASILPAARSAQGATYRLVDHSATVGEAATYVVYEAEERASERIYGPFVTAKGAAPYEGPRFDDQLTLPRPLTDRALRRVAAAKADLAASSYDPIGLQSVGSAAIAPASARIQVRETGMQTVSSLVLAEAMGVGVEYVERWIRNGRLRLTLGQRQVSWTQVAGNTGIVFYGQSTTDVSAPFEAYKVRRGAGRVMASVEGSGGPGTPGLTFEETLALEQQVFAGTLVASDPTDDFWFWRSLNAGHPSQGVFNEPLDVPGAVGAGVLRVHLFGASGGFAAVDHSIRVAINGIDLGVVEWAGVGRNSAEFVVPDGVLVDGANQFEMNSDLTPGVPYGFAYVDRFELTYERALSAVAGRLSMASEANGRAVADGFGSANIGVYELISPTTVRRIFNPQISGVPGAYAVSFPTQAGRRYELVELGTETAAAVDRWVNWELPQDGAEYVVITPRQFVSAAERLAESRAGQGLSTLVVEYEGLQTAYSEGRATPAAIAEFLERAWEHWLTKPRYVALMGKGSFDYRDYQGLGANPLPPQLVATGAGLYASDLQLADVEGNDGRPEFAIGRIPVLTASEAHDYVDKLIDYEQPGGAVGADRVVLLSDNGDGAGNFLSSSIELTSRLNGFDVIPLDLQNRTAVDVKDQLQVELAAGAFWLNYYGHGGLDRFAHEGLLTSVDVASMNNGGGLPIVSSLTCSVARFEIPGLESLAERLVLESTGGAIAVFAPGGTSLHSLADRLGQALFDQAFGGASTLGDAVVGAMRDYDGPAEQLATYHLLGDPAISLQP